ncbi:hypothetical protein H5410_041398 [Solanum commersonii]|uniref:Uncharacterized protein n=1 Tax=Solanum commersonii TaxID=4109 RepID=A0A9J5XUE7_SOLCO|nr:hypothetical protein H5410_041398 [Solanum commersonii]
MYCHIAQSTKPEDAKNQSQKAMELTKGRIAEWISDPDLLRRMLQMQLYLRVFGLLDREVLKTKITNLMVCGYWVVMGSARENDPKPFSTHSDRESEWTKM